MPSLIAEGHGIPAVTAFSYFLGELLAHAVLVKPTAAIEPPLHKSDFQDLLRRLGDVLPGHEAKQHGSLPDTKHLHLFAIVETAVRDAFTEMIATTSIDSPDFVRVWNLLDLVSILANASECEPALIFWLVEELLDGQTIDGCRTVFEYLESRRENITAQHHSQKLVVLRACNELLRRLSRAEDAAFCGRIFIYMFQSFPLGDRSSVNLRGEYHVENVTTFDEVRPNPGELESMDVDVPADDSTKARDEKSAKSASVDVKRAVDADKPLDADALYSKFWSLQASFSQPKRLFEPTALADLKSALAATMAAFRSVSKDQGSQSKSDRNMEKQTEDIKRNLKRKRQDNDEPSSGFNPKYLTSRDLFELELGDLSFRRHILIQALIVMDFLLSLSPKSKEKLATVTNPNKSVMYADRSLSEDDAKWATETKKAINDYLLRSAKDGPYFSRMVETVLSRDKNWVRWKTESCPTIERPTVAPEVYSEAMAKAKRMATSKRMKPAMGSLPLDFLGGRTDGEMDKYRVSNRHALPELASFKRKIADDDFEIEMPTNSKTKAAAVEGKASKTWRALRIASRCKLAAFDKIDNDDNIDFIFEEGQSEELDDSHQEAVAGDVQFPEDRSPVVVVDGQALNMDSDASAVLGLLLHKHAKIFSKVPVHVTRPPREGEKNGVDYNFVDSQAFSMLRDSDHLLAFSDHESGVHNYGISRKAVEFVSESGKIPILGMDHQCAQQLKDLGYSARFFFVEGPALEDAEHLQPCGLYAKVISRDTQVAIVQLEGFILGKDAGEKLVNGTSTLDSRV